MSLQEKTSWFNLISLIIALVFYISLFIAGDIIINYNTSIAMFLSASLIMILCNLGFIIFYMKSIDPLANLNEPDANDEKKAGLYPYVFYWGAFIGILAGTSLWLSGLSGGLISRNGNTLIIISSFLLGVLFVVILFKYKKVRGDALETDNYKAKDILMQKSLVGYDERDLHIRKTSNKIGLIASYTVLFLGAFLIIFLAIFHFGTQILSLNIVYIFLIIAGILFFKHIVIQTATIIQYRMGS